MACDSIKYNLIAVDNELCDGNLGGIKEAYIALKSDVTVTETTLDGGEKAVTVAAAGTVAKPFKQYKFRKNTSTFTSTLNSDTDNMTFYWTSELSLVFKKTEAAKRMGLMSLVQNDTIAVIVDMNDNIWLLGKDEPLVASAGTHNVGTQRSDANQYEVTLTDESNEAPYTVDGWDGSLVAE